MRDGFVTEGTHTNIFMLQNGTLYTHPADRSILAGVTRGVLIKICDSLGIPVSQTPFTPEQMRAADEILVSSSLMGIRSVSELDGSPVGGNAPETVRAVREAYRKRFTEETDA